MTNFTKYLAGAAAIGGEAAYNAVKSVRLRGRFELTGQNISADFFMIAARPSRLRLHIDLPGLGVNESGYDGKDRHRTRSG